MRRFAFAIALAFTGLSLSALPAHAVEVAVIDIQDIMRDSSAAKSVKTQLDAKQREFQQQMSAKESALQKEEQELVKQKSVLSPEAFEQKVKGFRDKAVAAQREMQTKRATLDNSFGKALGQIQQQVVEISASIAKERGAKLVMPSSQVLYADPALDITAQVLTQLNQKLPSVSVQVQ